MRERINIEETIKNTIAFVLAGKRDLASPSLISYYLSSNKDTFILYCTEAGIARIILPIEYKQKTIFNTPILNKTRFSFLFKYIDVLQSSKLVTVSVAGFFDDQSLTSEENSTFKSYVKQVITL